MGIKSLDLTTKNTLKSIFPSAFFFKIQQ